MNLNNLIAVLDQPLRRLRSRKRVRIRRSVLAETPLFSPSSVFLWDSFRTAEVLSVYELRLLCTILLDTLLLAVCRPTPLHPNLSELGAFDWTLIAWHG